MFCSVNEVARSAVKYADSLTTSVLWTSASPTW